MVPPFTVEPARSEDLEPAFRLLFGRLGAEECRQRTDVALGMVHSGEFGRSGVLVAWTGRALRGVMLSQLGAGAAAVVWPPCVTPGAGQSAIADELVRRTCDGLRSRGAKLVHALLTDEEKRDAGPLERYGLRPITTLWHLQHNLRSVPDSPMRLTYQTYPSADPSVFGHTLLRSYEGTLDCPEINHVRDVEEVLAGHRAQGLHDPRRWWLAWERERPVGVLLLADVPALGGWDLSYLGVVPEARRRGVGRELTGKALAEAQRAGAPRLGLAVDERNGPARALYRELGFEPYDRRTVYLAVW